MHFGYLGYRRGYHVDHRNHAFDPRDRTCRVPTRPGKPGKMRVHLENLEISWNFEKFNKYHGKMT